MLLHRINNLQNRKHYSNLFITSMLMGLLEIPAVPGLQPSPPLLWLFIPKELGERAGVGQAYANLDNTYHSLDNFKLAIKYHNQDLTITKEVGFSSGSISEALDCYRLSVKLFEIVFTFVCNTVVLVSTGRLLEIPTGTGQI